MSKINDIPEEVKQKAIEKGTKLAKTGFKNLYGVKDEKMGFVEIIIGVNDGVMIRQFTQAVNNKNSNVGQYPQDFTLYYLGAMCEETGALYSKTRMIVNGKDLVTE